MKREHISYEVNQGIGVLLFNCPERLNAYNRAMAAEIVAVLSEAASDDAVRVLVVTAMGRAFCAGADLSSGESAFDRSQIDSPDDYRDSGGETALAFHHFPKPVIAAIQGHAVGVGIALCLAMDIRVAAEQAKIAFAFTRRGMVPDSAASYFLPRLVGAGKAAELIFTGRTFLAQEERESGLFNYVLPADEVLPRALAIAEEIAKWTAPVAVTLSKSLLRDSSQRGPEEVHLFGSRLLYWCGKSPDAREGVQSFLDKRPPQFPLSASRALPGFFSDLKQHTRDGGGTGEAPRAAAPAGSASTTSADTVPED